MYKKVSSYLQGDLRQVNILENLNFLYRLVTDKMIQWENTLKI